jgi:ABC-type uncharacterized transport system permease subunit
MEKMYSNMTALLFDETSIPINSGVMQGYSLSPLLFSVALDFMISSPESHEGELAVGNYKWKVIACTVWWL